MKRNFRYMACGIIVTVSLLLTGCNGGAAKPTDPSDALLATETTAATENTKATKPTTKATTPKPTTKPSTSKPTTGKNNNSGKTDTTKATEAPKPAENQKPAASEPAATQKPTEAPKPTNPPATEAPKPTNPPATEAPKPTDPPETEPPETEPPVECLDIDEAISYGRQYIQNLGAILDTGLAYDDPSYYPAFTFSTNSQSELNSLVIEKIDGDLATIKYCDEGSGVAFDIQYYRLDVLVEYDGDGWYAVTLYYG